jgi:hypothetical protein
MKQQRVAEFGDSEDESDADIMNFTVGVRDDRQHFIVYHGPGPESARNCIYWSALFLSCDVVFQVADARMKFIYDDPDPDKPLLPKSKEQEDHEFWTRHPELHPGMLGEAWERGERAGIQECIQISRYPIVGPPTIASYEYDRRGRRLVWGKIRNQPIDKHSGAIDDYVKEAFRRRKDVQPEIDKMLEKIHADMARQDFSARERRYWTDRGMAKMVSTRTGVFLVQYLSQIKTMPDAVFKEGQEIDPVTQEPVQY